AVGGEPGAVAEAVRLHDEAHDGGPGGAIVGGGGHVHEGPVGGGRVDAAGRVLREGPAVGDAARDDGRADGAGDERRRHVGPRRAVQAVDAQRVAHEDDAGRVV